MSWPNISRLLIDEIEKQNISKKDLGRWCGGISGAAITNWINTGEVPKAHWIVLRRVLNIPKLKLQKALDADFKEST